LLLLVLPGTCVWARVRKSESWARSQLAAADRLQEALNQHPASQRARHEYEHVIAAYRQVYIGAPASSSAPAGAMNAAGLLAEMGRQFDDAKALQAAIRQYQFLRDEYPNSKFRFQALFAIAEIYKDDLDDLRQAEQAFNEFLQRYPRHALADDARQALAEIVQAQKPSPVETRPEQTTDAAGADNPKPPAAGASDDPSDASNSVMARITGIRHWTTPDYTRVSVDLDRDVTYESQRIANPDRIYFDLASAKLAPGLVGRNFNVDDGFLKQIRVAQYEPGRARIVLDVDSLSIYDAHLLANPSRLVIDVRERPGAPPGDDARVLTATAKLPLLSTPATTATKPKRIIVEADDDDDSDTTPKLETAAARTTPKPAPSDDGDAPPARPAKTRSQSRSGPTAREARPTASGDRSLIRALGLKIGKIVIDPGHGGHDTGTIGPNGLLEKDLVLDVSKRLGKLLESRLGADVTFTRNDDTFIPLETRTSIANQDQADLFLSIHANSSQDPDARGVETYYLNFTSSADALEVAARENAVSDKSIHELQDLVKTIALKEKIEESREFASDVQRSLHSGLSVKNAGLRDRGVKKAPFIVLIGANMPSILAEISFVSNPGDERRLKTPEYRQRIAESLYRGIAKYVGGLSGVKVASKVDHAVAQ